PDGPASPGRHPNNFLASSRGANRTPPPDSRRGTLPDRSGEAGATMPSHPWCRIEPMANEARGRIVGVIGTCSAGGCLRPAVRHVEFISSLGRLAGVVCEQCAMATSSAVFLLELIA